MNELVSSSRKHGSQTPARFWSWKAPTEERLFDKDPKLSLPKESQDTNHEEPPDPLLKLFQGFAPPHIRVLKRDHPARLPDETEEDYEIRWQFYEYAKLHPLVPKNYFYDFEVKDELLVPINESSSSSTASLNDRAEVEIQCEAEGSGDDWENESLPCTPPELYHEGHLMRNTSADRVCLHPTLSIFQMDPVQLPPVPKTTLHPDQIKKKSDQNGREPSNNNAFGDHLPATRRSTQRHPLQSQFSNRPVPRLPPINERIPHLPSLKSLPSTHVKANSSSNQPNSLKRRLFVMLEQVLQHHSTTSVPNQTWFNNAKQRKQLSERYTFSLPKSSLRNKKPTSRSSIDENLRKLYYHQQWASERLSSGLPTTSKPIIKINKTNPTFCKYSCHTKKFPVPRQYVKQAK